MIPTAGMALATLLSLSLAAASEATVTGPVRIQSGLVAGVAEPEGVVVAFLGIPYAAPPLGDLRWREPQAPPAWAGVRAADRSGARCVQALSAPSLPFSLMQPKEAAIVQPPSEDCLHLDVFTPARTGADRLAVLVNLGRVAGGRLARQGIVVVSVDHRVGIIGGMGHPELSRESPHHLSGDYGFLDLIAALQWVHRNITAFGGDPDRVTVAGYSVGSAFVHHLTASPVAKGLFRGAICMSFPYDYLLTRDKVGNVWQKEQEGLQFAAAKHASGIADLRRLPATDLLAPDPLLAPFTRAVLGSVICVDGWALPAQYPQAFAQGLSSDVPTLTGFPVDDGVPPHAFQKCRMATFPADLASAFGRSAAAYDGRKGAYLALVAPGSDEEARSLCERAQVEFRAASTVHWVRRRAQTARTPVYGYVFTRVIPCPEHPEFGAFHTSDLPYLFDNLDTLNHPWTSVDRQVAAQVSAYWANFVKHLDPNGDGLPTWAPLTPDEPTTMALGERCAPLPIAPERMRFYLDLLEDP